MISQITQFILLIKLLPFNKRCEIILFAFVNLYLEWASHLLGRLREIVLLLIWWYWLP